MKSKKFQKKKMPHAAKKIDASQNSRIMSIEKKIKDMENDPELKWWDHQIELLAASPVTVPVNINPLLQGTTSTTRLANRVQATSVQGRYTFIQDENSLAPYTGRVIVFWDKGPKGAACATTDLLDLTTITSANSNTVYAPYNLKNAPRFKILYDKSFTVNPIVAFSQENNASGTPNDIITFVPVQSHPYHFKIPLKRVVNYGLGNAGTIADISQNALYVVCLSDIAVGADPPQMTGGFRFIYKDC